MKEIAHFEELVETVRGDIQHLVPQAARILKEQSEVKAYLSFTPPELSTALTTLDRELVHSILRRALLSDVELEIVFTTIRRACLLSATSLQEHYALLVSVAAQCFNNDYAWSQSEEETQAVEELSGREEITEEEALRIAMYSPLCQVRAELLQPHLESADPEFRFLLSKQLREPLLEAELQQTMPTLGEVADSTSKRVAKQYEEWPYPRWFCLPAQTTEVLSERLSVWCPEAFCSLSSDILVPGCGSGQHPLHLARTFPESQVTGLDLSLASLAYAKRRAQEFGLNNVDFWHGDLLALGEYEQWREKFGFVDAVGVLHHLNDPAAGCQALVQVLAPGGLARIGLYSSRARREVGIESARESLEGGESLREARGKLLDSELPQLLDFFTLNGFRDLIFPAQETTYTLPEAVEMLAEGGLRAVGLQVPRSIKARFLKEFGPSLTDWESWDRYEQRCPNTFTGMYHLLAVAR